MEQQEQKKFQYSYPTEDAREWVLSRMAKPGENGFHYTLNEDGATIVWFEPDEHQLTEGETAAKLIVPHTLGGAPVTKLGLAVFAAVEAEIDWDRDRLDGGYGGRSYSFQHALQGVEEIVLPPSLREIGIQAFRYLTTLRHILLPDGLERIKSRACEGCTGLEEVALPDTLQVVEDSAFAETGLTAAVLPEKLSCLPRGTFRDCKRLKQVTLPDRLRTLFLSAFWGCDALEALRMSPPGEGTLKSEEMDTTAVWQEWEPEERFKESWGVELTGPGPGGFCSVDGVLYTRDGTCLACYPVGKQDASFTVPGSVTKIGVGAFRGNGWLEQVVIPSGVDRLRKDTFRDCTALRQVVLPEGLKEIGKEAFRGCAALKEIALRPGLEAIGYRAFDECSSLSVVDLPDTLSRLGDSAFSGCNVSGELRLPRGLKSRRLTWGRMDGIERLWIPRGVESIDWGYCPSLREIAVEENHPTMKVVDGVLFSRDGTELLKMPAALPVSSYRIPQQVRWVERNAFMDCRYLEEIAFPEGWTWIPDSFQRCTALKTIHFPTGVKRIDNLAFEDCTALEHLELPDGLTEVGNYTFAGCTGLRSVVIPASVKKFGVSLFSGCNQLTDVLLTGGARKWCNRTVIKDRKWNFPDCAVFRYR